MFTLTIETDNDAFADGNEGQEIARILRVTAKKVEDGVTSGRLIDYNGNIVGEFAGTNE